MYGDYVPVAKRRDYSGKPNEIRKVVVIEEEDRDPVAVIKLAEKIAAVSQQGSEKRFWIMFANAPEVVQGLAEPALRYRLR